MLATIAKALRQGLPAAFEPLKESDFYEGYGHRLQSKLDQKKIQMARDELLLGVHSEGQDQSLQASLRQAAREQEEIEFLLKQLDEQIASFHKLQ